MKRIIFLACSLAQATLSPAQDVIGDMNADKKLDAADVAQLVSYLTGRTTQKKYVHEVEAYIDADGAFKGKESTAHLCGDINDDYELTKADVDLMISSVIGKTDKKTFYSAERYLESDGRVSGKYTIKGTEYTLAYSIDCVDFDLPSGKLWARENIGATDPQNYGNYYAWGELEANKESYTLANYSLYDPEKQSYLSYYYNLKGASIKVLTTDDDVVNQTMGGDWVIPTAEEFSELRQNCYWCWTTNYNGKGIKGFIVYKPFVSGDNNTQIGKTPASGHAYSINSDPYIFLPVCGRISGSDKTNIGTIGYYWLRELSSTSNSKYMYLSSSSATNTNKNCYRYYGLSVRGICPKK